MHAGTGVLAVVGSICMTLALVLAWCLAGVRSSRLVRRCFPIVVAMSVGSVGNPSGFLALKPGLPQKPATPFGAVMVLSFTATTVGYGGAAWYVAHAIIHTVG
jgi:hypothetical protein